MPSNSLENPSIAEIKRFLELYTGIQSFHEEVNQDLDLTNCPFGFKFRPSVVRPIIDSDHLKYLQTNDIRPSESVVAYRKFIREKIGWRHLIRTECDPIDPQFSAWRARQMKRTKAEFGVARDDYYIHVPVMFELAQGCSVGCWFCGFSAPKLATLFTYTQENAKLWRGVLQVALEVVGPGARWAAPYFATDPLDNPEHERFCEDFYDVMGIWPQTTTAISHKHIERVRELLRISREKGCRTNRFSILSTKILEKIHRAFTPEELLNVELILQSQESTEIKSRAGRFNDLAQKNYRIDAREKEKVLNSLLTVLDEEEAIRHLNEAPTEETPGTICCMTGFLINMVEKSIKLVSPVGADERWPLGMIVYDYKYFSDADDLRHTMQDMQANVKTEMNVDDAIGFNRKLNFTLTEQGFVLSSGANRVNFENDRAENANWLRTVGEMVAKGNQTTAEISLLSFYKTMKPVAMTRGLLKTFFDSGLLDEEPDFEPMSYYQDSGPQLIGEKPDNRPSSQELAHV